MASTDILEWLRSESLKAEGETKAKLEEAAREIESWRRSGVSSPGPESFFAGASSSSVEATGGSSGMVKLNAVPRILRGAYSMAPSYQQLYNACVRGDIPAEQSPTGRWYVDPSKIPEIASVMKVAVGDFELEKDDE